MRERYGEAEANDRWTGLESQFSRWLREEGDLGGRKNMMSSNMMLCYAVCAFYAGEFTYFLLRDDTMETTYHIEFRYGSDLDQLQKYMTGDYAYWLSAGIDEAANEDTIHDVIDLFITENAA